MGGRNTNRDIFFFGRKILGLKRLASSGGDASGMSEFLVVVL